MQSRVPPRPFQIQKSLGDLEDRAVDKLDIYPEFILSAGLSSPYSPLFRPVQAATQASVSFPALLDTTCTHPSKPSPLALLPASIPSIPGDETTFGGFARNSSTILLLVASAEEAPFAVGIAEK
uniref:Uncharacterized protein n=1 Tax=Oryza glumipatula TaxID=40148 RepID=A0A0D9YRC2_9ORYZ